MKSRLKDIYTKLGQAKLDALVLFSPANISYLTEYRSRDSYLIVSPKHNVYVTDSRYTAEARQEFKGLVQVEQIQDSALQTIASVCAKLRFRRVGFEEKHLLFASYRNMRKLFGKNIALIPTHGLIEGLRQVKSPEELKKLAQAAKITASALKFIRSFISPGKKEVEIAAEIERFIRYHGADGAAFEIIVASGPNAAFPHHVSSQRKVRKGELVLVDMGVDYFGYKSDLTRVFFLGKINVLTQRVYDIVREAQNLAILKIKPGVKISEIDAASRGYIASKGYAGCFGHNLGHGVGLEVHEAPAISSKNNALLQEGMVFTLEPGIYLPGKFGIRIEDMALVTHNGVKILSGNLEK